MNLRVLLLFAVVSVFVSGDFQCLAQTSSSNDALATQAEKEYAAGNYADAERDFGELVKLEPSNIYAYLYLGQSSVPPAEVRRVCRALREGS